MSAPEYTIRNYKATDFEDVAGLLIKQSSNSGRPKTIEEVAGEFKRPGFSPEEDLFIAEAANRIVGYAHLTAEAAIDRVHLRSWIEPSFRRKGIVRAFLPHVVRRTGELGISAIHVGVFQDNRIARDMLPKLGFKYVRRYLELVLEIEKVPQEEIDEACKGCRQLRDGEEDKLLAIQNRAFDRHWGYNPNTLETITYDINLNNRSPEDVVFACEEEAVIGYCWTEIVEISDISGTEKRGIINMIGTEPEYRGRGLGRKVLLAGLAYLKKNSVKTVELTVDSENKAAYELYRSLGFKEQGSTLWYEKTVV